MKLYVKPDAEEISLIAKETITDDLIDGEVGLESSELDG